MYRTVQKTTLPNILDIFAQDNMILVPDRHPVYVDTSHGGTNISYINALNQNGFCPKPSTTLMRYNYIWLPNSPTGAVYTK